ncbi:MAG: hypothetical protein D6729_13785 [Deltaproteobacteria bacterium]|nr:MAG: hypothetical protein D6729_13785 [Deltaproteobacteria bacterium]
MIAMHPRLLLFLATSAATFTPTLAAQAHSLEARAEVETGPTYILQNDNRFGADGSLIDANTAGQQRNLALSYRNVLELAIGPHRVVFLYAPFQLTTRFTAEEEIRFKNVAFAPGTVLDFDYLFDGYRGSYLYRLLDGEALTLELGASFQVRNAAVAIRDAEGRSYVGEYDIGLVFALKGRLRYQPRPELFAELEADGLSTLGLFGVGGAIYDASLTLGLPIGSSVDILFRLRLLGGGADVPRRDIFNWGNFFSATAGVRIHLSQLARDLARPPAQ